VSISAVDHNATARFFGLDEASSDWLAELAQLSGPPVPLPDRGAVAEVFGRLGGDPSDLAELEALRSEFDTSAVGWLFERCVRQLVNGIGIVQPGPPWPALAADQDALNRYFYVYVFLAAVPQVREFHRQRGISDEISWASLADLGQQMSVRRRIFGAGGLHTQTWLTIPFSGLLYQLGRLQFNLYDIIGEQQPYKGVRAPFGAGHPVLGVHIPERGRLDPQACDDSFDRAREFFPQHFPEREHRYATCNSWLLDPQLAEYLPADSNVVRFQRRFTQSGPGTDDDNTVFEFVFRRLNPPLDELPQDTTLQRAVVAHLRTGRHWQPVSGWLEL
jgi:hypothetical protein